MDEITRSRTLGAGTKLVSIEQVYQMLFGQRFTEWHLTRFEAHICGDEDCPSKEEILVDLKGLLK